MYLLCYPRISFGAIVYNIDEDQDSGEHERMQEENTIPEMVDEVREGKMQRRQFIKRLTLMGVSAAGVGAIVAAAASRQFATSLVPQGNSNSGEEHIQRHDDHLTHQSQGNMNQLQHDYAEHAVVEDSMHPHPFVGREAIMARKNTGFTAMPDLQIKVTNRIVHGNQLTVEWVASGTHSGNYPGLIATGRTFSIPGVTVVVRHDGKIVRESLYYDLKEVQRQIGAS